MENKTNTQFRVSKEDTFMEVARVFSLRSTCLRKKVGAVLVDRHNQYILSSGYNGAPTGVVSCQEKGACYRMEHNIPSGERYELCKSLHSESNAIMQVGIKNTEGCYLYVYGHSFICMMCARMIIQAGIKHIFIKENESSPIKEISVDELKASL